MKFCHYVHKNAEGIETEGVCHRSKLEHLSTDTTVLFTVVPISDEHHAKLVEGWGGVEVAPAAKAKPKKNAKQEGDALV